MDAMIPGAVEVLLPVVMLLAYAAFIGAGLQCALARYIRLPASMGMAAGLGFAATAVAIALAHRMGVHAGPPITILLAASAISIGLKVILVARQSPARLRISRWGVPSSTDGIAVLIALLAMSPVLGYGLTYWTNGTADFPSYVASAEIWTSSPEEFKEKHPDAFGSFQLERASFEKPMVTALMVASSKVTGTPPFQLLPVLQMAFVFILASSLALVSLHVFRLGPVTSFLAISIPSLSVSPMGRFYDAQLGQTAAIALFALLLAAVSTVVFRRTWSGRMSAALMIGIVGTSVTGANFTLIAGSSMVLAALVIWVLSRRLHEMRERLWVGAFALIFIISLSLPMAGMYLRSAAIQSGGEPGFDIPLVNPLAVIGQQISIGSGGPLNQVLWAWVVVFCLSAAVVAAIPRSGDPWRRRCNYLLLFMCAGNACFIGFKLGWNNYGLAKWTALAISLVAPLALASIISALNWRGRFVSAVAMLPLSISSAAFGLNAKSPTITVIDNDFMALRDSQDIRSKKVINIALGDIHLNSLAALIVPARRVIVTEKTYAAKSKPEGDVYLVPSSRGTSSRALVLNSSYAIATPPRIPSNGDAISFVAGEFYDQEGWYSPEPWGTWLEDVASLEVRLDPKTSTDVIFEIETRALVGPLIANRTLDVRCRELPCGTFEYSLDEPSKTVLIRFPFTSIVDSHARLTFSVSPRATPSSAGVNEDMRQIGIGISSVAISLARE